MFRTVTRPLAGILLGMVATLLLAPAVLAAAPERFVDRNSGTVTSFDWTMRCGVPIESTFDNQAIYTTFEDGSYRIHWMSHETLTGPGGSIELVSSYAFAGDEPPEVIDPGDGSMTEIFRETYTGVRQVTEAGGGVVFVDAGLYYATVAVTYPADGGEPTITTSDEISHGNHPGLTNEEFAALVCSQLV